MLNIEVQFEATHDQPQPHETYSLMLKVLYSTRTKYFHMSINAETRNIADPAMAFSYEPFSSALATLDKVARYSDKAHRTALVGASKLATLDGLFKATCDGQGAPGWRLTEKGARDLASFKADPWSVAKAQ